MGKWLDNAIQRGDLSDEQRRQLEAWRDADAAAVSIRWQELCDFYDQHKCLSKRHSKDDALAQCWVRWLKYGGLPDEQRRQLEAWRDAEVEAGGPGTSAHS